MTISRSSFLALALLAGASAAQSQTTTDAKLRMAAKAALGRLEVRQKNTPGPGETTIIKAVRLLELSFGPVLITEVTIDNGSHAEEGALGVYYLKRLGDRYVVLKSWSEAIEGGGFGYAPEWSVSTRFTKFPAIYAEAGWSGQGYTCGWAILAELTPSGPIVSDAVHTSFSDAGVGSGKVHEYNGRISNIRKANSFDVVAGGEKGFVEHYVFKGGKFVRTTEDSRLQC